MTQCYMCSLDAISQEHVPPSCIFPETKDLPPGIDYRKRLITVPSCAEHNLRKSGDDEYFLYLLVSNWAANPMGLRQWATKLRRSIKRRPAKLGIFRNPKLVTIKGVKTGVYDIDINRIFGEVEKISRGIYFHHFQKHWPHPIEVILPAAIATGTSQSSEQNKIVRSTATLVRRFLEKEILHGDNPDIFYYQLKITEDIPGYILRMVFYGGIEIATLSNLPEIR